MTTTTKTKPAFLAILALLLAATMAALTLTAPGAAQAAPGKANPAKTCSERGDTIFGFPGEPPSTRGGCASYVATGEDGDPTGAGYAAQCRTLAEELGPYPFTFYGQITVDNHGECVKALRSFHTTPPPA
ncbi:MAG: hypothetical protein AVDCRST_MAG55-3379 [uncultured Rubrobacteraceae bacterium]|uniref:Uncharacterized protein n=1 Tax=uncultured Rubrobacteraceae bacterium TaxID=349277 RepID=A0A6J4QCX6_9ACTN|nr:MAG: hypothetical protein AVDCRST_MAG55-3379 [uncultured Rubrobacteraceae bacterium]